MRITYLAPTAFDIEVVEGQARHLATIPRDAGTRISVEASGLGAGLPLSGMGRLSMEAGIVALGARAATDGSDAIVVDSIIDAGVDALRSRVGLPVIGAGRAAMVYGAMLGGRSVIAVRTPDERRAVARAVVLGMARDLVDDIVVVGSGPEAIDAVLELARAASGDGRAGTLILGHPELAGHAARVREQVDMVVIDPGALALTVAEAMVDLGLRHSGIAYLTPAADLDHLLDERLRWPDRMAVDVPPPTHAPRPYRLKVVVPISGMTESDVGLRAAALSPGLLHASTRVDYRSLSDSSNSGDCQYDTFLLDLFCAEEELMVDEEGYDAVLVDSTTDSGIPAVRSHLEALALGPGEACWALASVMGEHFTILSMERKWEFFFIKGPKSLGLLERLASVEDVGKAPDPVRLFEGKEDLMNELLIEAARRGIDEHGADVIIIGSTTMHQALPALEQALPVPVLSPGRIGVRTAEMLLDLGLRHRRPLDEAAATEARAIFEATSKKASPIVHA